MHSLSNLKSPQTLATANFLTHFIISIAVLENVPAEAGLQKKANFSTLNVGLARTGNRTRATCGGELTLLDRNLVEKGNWANPESGRMESRRKESSRMSNSANPESGRMESSRMESGRISN
jgi:hypothetical protein